MPWISINDAECYSVGVECIICGDTTTISNNRADFYRNLICPECKKAILFTRKQMDLMKGEKENESGQSH